MWTELRYCLIKTNKNPQLVSWETAFYSRLLRLASRDLVTSQGVSAIILKVPVLARSLEPGHKVKFFLHFDDSGDRISKTRWGKKGQRVTFQILCQ